MMDRSNEDRVLLELHQVSSTLGEIKKILAGDDYGRAGLVARVERLENIVNPWYHRWGLLSGLGGGAMMLYEFWQLLKPVLIK